jgi:hypothetical protein
MDVLMALPADTVVLPGHSDPTTIGDERERNPFIRVWRGLDAEGNARCEADGDPARMIVWAHDYDDGHRAWIRRADGTDLVLAGSPRYVVTLGQVPVVDQSDPTAETWIAAGGTRAIKAEWPSSSHARSLERRT